MSHLSFSQKGAKIKYGANKEAKSGAHIYFFLYVFLVKLYRLTMRVDIDTKLQTSYSHGACSFREVRTKHWH